MKKLYTPTYKSYLATQKRKRSDALFAWLKNEFRRVMIEKLYG